MDTSIKTLLFASNYGLICPFFGSKLYFKWNLKPKYEWLKNKTWRQFIRNNNKYWSIWVALSILVLLLCKLCWWLIFEYFNCLIPVMTLFERIMKRLHENELKTVLIIICIVFIFKNRWRHSQRPKKDHMSVTYHWNSALN